MPNSSNAPILPPRNPRRHPVYDVRPGLPDDQPPPLPPKPKSNKTACNSPLNKHSGNYYTGSNGNQRRPASCPLQSENADEKPTPKPNRKSSRSSSRKRRRRRTPTDALLLGNRYQVGVSPSPQVLRSAETRSPTSPLFCNDSERHCATPPVGRSNPQSNSITCRCSHQCSVVDVQDNHLRDDGARSQHCHNASLRLGTSPHCLDLESPNSCFNMDTSTIECGEAFTHTKQVASSGIRAKLSKLKHLLTRVPHHKHHQVGSTPPPAIRRAFSAHRKHTSDSSKDERQTAVPRMYSPHRNQSEVAKFSPVHLRTGSLPSSSTNSHHHINASSSHAVTTASHARNHDLVNVNRLLSGQPPTLGTCNTAFSATLNGTQPRRPHSRAKSCSRNRSQTKTPEDEAISRQTPPPMRVSSECTANLQRPRPQMIHQSIAYNSSQSPPGYQESIATGLQPGQHSIQYVAEDSSTARAAASQTRREHRKMATFLENINALQKMGYYWGSITYEEAEILLKDRKDGTFLVRDSAHDSYFLTLSFRAFNTTFHTRIEYVAGQFGFYSLPGDKAVTIVEFIRQAVERCENGRFHYFLQTSNNGQNGGAMPDSPAIPVSILYPMSRFTVVCSLQQLCRASILRCVRRDLMDRLPLPSKLKQFLLEKQYSPESLTRFVEETKDLEPLSLSTTLPDRLQSMNL